MLERIAKTCYERRRVVLLLWVVAFVAMAVLGRVGGGPFSTNFTIPGSESKKALDLLEQRFPERAGDTITVVYEADRGARDPAVRARAEQFFQELSRFPHVAAAISPYGPQGANNFSPDGTIAFGTLQLDVQGSDIPATQVQEMVEKSKEASGGGVRFELSGTAIQFGEFEAGGAGEGLGILAAVIILLISFGSVLAMGLPILTAIMSIGIGLALLQLFTNILEVPDFAPIVAAMVGIGVGIDYALFIVTRYRTTLDDGADPERATIVAIATAGRSVLFAGTTVVISVLGILLMGLPIMQGVAVGSAAAVLVAMIASLTLLPAMLGFVGPNIDKLKVPFVSRPQGHHREGFWFRWSRIVQHRPWPALVAGILVIGALTIPAFSLRVGFPGEESMPESRASRRSYDLLTKGFGPGFSAPLLVAVELPPGREEPVHQLESRFRTEPGLATVVPASFNASRDTALILTFPTSSGDSVETEELVKRLREDVIPPVVAGSGLDVSVGGPNAAFIDQATTISSRLPLFIVVVVGLSFVLLMAVFRSVLVALKAAVMNLLSIGAAYGVLVAVAQWGWLKGLFGIPSTGPIASFIPMMMFAILFGLSMDYEVFLLSRVREEYEETNDNALAVADGLAATARVITAAAAIMIMVFLAFVLGPELAIKQVGLGLAAAIFIDATIVRMVLVPSTMELMGRANWWLPGWLDRLLPQVSFEAPPGPELGPAAVTPAPAGPVTPTR